MPTTYQEPNSGLRRHKLLTAEIEKRLPAHGSTDGDENAQCIVKFFSPYNGWTWYAFEYDPENRLFFGCVDGFEMEWGDFSLAELAEANRNGLPLIERDCSFTATITKADLNAKKSQI